MTIGEIIKRLAESERTLQQAEVMSVSGITCRVKLISDDTELFDVGLATQENGVLMAPKVGSFVLVALLNHIQAYVVSYGELDSIKLGDGTFGGLIKIEDLVTDINSIKTDINDLKDIFSTWTVVPSDGGAALKTLLATYFASPLNDLVKADIENNKITHGNI